MKMKTFCIKQRLFTFFIQKHHYYRNQVYLKMNENINISLSEIESRKKQISSHSRQWRVEREMKIMIFRDQEEILFLLSIFLMRSILSSMPALGPDGTWQTVTSSRLLPSKI